MCGFVVVGVGLFVCFWLVGFLFFFAFCEENQLQLSCVRTVNLVRKDYLSPVAKRALFRF